MSVETAAPTAHTRAPGIPRSLRWPLPWRFAVPRALALWLATRALDVALTILFTSGSAAQRLDHWHFWDGGFYMLIAQHGYGLGAPRGAALAGYFPLYPLLMHLIAPTATHYAVELPALVVSNLALLGALVAVGLLAAYEQRTVHAALLLMLLLAVSPLGVFLSGMYADGLFLALAAWALLAARRGAWTWAALAAALATGTRPYGLALLPALVVEYASQHAWPWRLRVRAFTLPLPGTVRQAAVLVGGPVLTLGAFLVVLWRQYGGPLAYVHAQAYGSGHAFRWPWQTLALAVQQLAAVQPHWSYPTAHMLIDLVPLVGSLAVLLVCARRWPLAYTVYTALVVLLMLCAPVIAASGPNGPYAVIGDGRYCYALVPVLVQAGAWLQRSPRWGVAALCGVSLLLQCALTVFVLRGGWLV
jgi:hypothetical protein